MGRAPETFDTRFTRFDLAASYLCHFAMWLMVAAAYLLLEPRLRGHAVVKSPKVYGLMGRYFASVTAIDMHRCPDRESRPGSIVDGARVFGLVAVADRRLFPLVLRGRHAG